MYFITTCEINFIILYVKRVMCKINYDDDDVYPKEHLFNFIRHVILLSPISEIGTQSGNFATVN